MNNTITGTHIYKTTGICPIYLDTYINPERYSPVIVYIHGGALIWGSRKSINQTQLSLYLEAGFSVVSIDYRLAPETRLPEIVQDIKDALSWVKTDLCSIYGVCTDKLAVIGHSAGGYLALLSGTFDAIKPDAIVSFYGYGDITGKWYSEPSSFYCTMPIVSEEQALSCVGNHAVSEGSKDRFQYYLL